MKGKNAGFVILLCALVSATVAVDHLLHAGEIYGGVRVGRCP